MTFPLNKDKINAFSGYLAEGCLAFMRVLRPLIAQSVRYSRMFYHAFSRYFARFLGRVFRIRQRNCLTQAHTLRLRFIAAPLLMLMLFPFLMNSSETSATTFMSSSVEETATRQSHKLAFSSRTQEVYGQQAGALEARVNIGEIADAKKESPYLHAARFAASKKPAPARPLLKEISIASGDVISVVLQKAGMSASETHKAVEAMSDHLDPRKIKPGQKIEVTMKPSAEGGYDFSEMRVIIDPIKSIVVSEANEEMISRIDEKSVHKRLHAQRATIETSLFGSALKAGMPSRIIGEAIRIYSWDVDFQRDIRSGDVIELFYETYVTDDGELAKYGDIIYASLSVGGNPIPMYRYESKTEGVDYFRPDGHSARKALMKTPVDGARLSSGYGMRKHPILGYNKMHKGQDFAAPTGTPIYAAGDGTVEKAARWSSYGNYIRIRHNSELKTAYAHLHKFGKGITAGKRVKQGQVIGYVGSTGRSTGPHLHYEVIQNGKHVNPAKLDLPQGKKLQGEDLRQFRLHAEDIQKQFESMVGEIKLVKRDAQAPVTN